MMTKKLFLDIVERMAGTFVATFASLFVFTGDLDTDIDVAKKAAVAGVAAVVTLLKGIAASRFGDTGTAAALPASASTPPSN